MSDRYLYKAKTKCIVDTYNFGKEDGEWVKGYLYCDTGKWVIKEFEYDRADYVCYEIDPETICQCTGLTDKNGKKIWENDIVRRTDLHNVKEPSVGFIEYDMENTAFLIHWIDVVNYSATYPWKERIEVIGNIFDNPELLEEGAE